jgi:hypothetical protein
MLHDVLASATEESVAAQLHISIRSLRRYAAGTVNMNWITRTRLERMATELEARRAAELEAARHRIRPVRKCERAPESYPRVPEPAVALT